MKKILSISAVLTFALSGCMDSEADIYKKVVDDSIKQYEIAKRNGTQMDVCANAGMVKAAFLQAKDETNYSKWVEIEKQDCELAGLPR